MKLDTLEIGKDAVVASVASDDQALRQHILDMGLTPGTEVTMMKYAPMGDPLEIRLRGYELTLRKDDAARIELVDVHDTDTGPRANAAIGTTDHPALGEGMYSPRAAKTAVPEGAPLHFALAGNQNCGKTTLFNQLTGSNQHVGNFPGVTVDRKDGTIRNHPEASVTDLPGIYSLSPYTGEEIVSRQFILDENPDAIIDIIDATNIERNLYLTLQLMELDRPMVIALNMMDEVTANGGAVDVNLLESLLGVPVVPISAARNEGIGELVDHALHVARFRERPGRLDFCAPDGSDGGALHRCIHGIANLIEDHAVTAHIPVRFAATKLVEGDEPMFHALNLDTGDIHIIDHIVEQMEQDLGTDREAALADMRYTYIESLCSQCVVKHQETREQLRSEKIDRFLTNKYLGIPIFLLIMMAIFWLTFSVIGAPLQDLLSRGIDSFTASLEQMMTNAEVTPWLISLIVNGVCAGVGSVLSFLPIIVLLFFFLSLLEDSGYMARVAFVMDKLLRKIGLSGRSFVPMLIGFGCSVPAIMATRTLSSDRDRKMTIVLTPFMSCSAKLPIYGMITAAFFPEHGALVMISLYILGIVVAILSGLLLKSTIFQGNSVPFVMELPAYRLPDAKSVLLHMWEKAKDFLHKAFTIIFIASIVIWFLQSFDWKMNMVSDSSMSILASIGSVIAPIFAPLGFNDWRASTALITGFTAKESVVSTLTILTGAANDAQLCSMLSQIFTPLSAFSFLAFTILYMPCVAAFAASKRELGSMKQALLTAGYQTLTAYLVALVIFQVGSLIV